MTAASGDSPRKPRDPAKPAVSGQWVGTWAASAAAAEPGTLDGYAGMSIRNVVHTSVGGSARADPALQPLRHAPAAGQSRLAGAGRSAQRRARRGPDTMRRLTFGGRPAVSIPAGGAVASDPVRLDVPHDADLLVTTYSPSAVRPRHLSPVCPSDLLPGTGGTTPRTPRGTAYTEQSPYWRYLTGVDVWSTEARGTVVAIGDSITDGITSTAGANHRWPDFLAARLRNEPGPPATASSTRASAATGCWSTAAAARQQRPQRAVPLGARRALAHRREGGRRRDRHQRHRSGHRASSTRRRSSPACGRSSARRSCRACG